MGRKVRICIVVMLFSITFIPLASNQADSCSSFGPSIQIAQPKQTAYVAPGQDGMVTFYGQVFAQVPWTPESEGLIVDLVPDAGELCVVGPPSLLFSRAEKQKSYSVRVYVPSGTSASCQGQLSVSGRWRHLNTTMEGTLPPATAIIVIEPFRLIDLDSPEGFIHVEQGDDIKSYIEVRNMGNSEDRIRSEISNLEELEDEGWDISFGPNNNSIEEGEIHRIDLTMRSSGKVDPGLYKVNISSISTQGMFENEPPVNYTLFIQVGEMELLGIDYGVWVVMGGTLIILLGMVVSFQVMNIKKNNIRKPRPGIHGPGFRGRYEIVSRGRLTTFAKFVQQSP